MLPSPGPTKRTAPVVPSAVLLAVLGACASSSPARPHASTAPPRPAPSLAGDTPAQQEAPAPKESPSEEPGSRPAEAASPQEGGGLPVAYVGDRPIDVRALLELWMHRESNALAELLETLVASELALAEAARLGVRLDPDLVEAELRIGRRMIEEQLAAGGRGLSLEEYVTEVLGLDPDRYLERLRRDTRRQLVVERVVRAWTLSSPHAITRVIVVPSEARLEAVREALAEGRPFAEVAREFSIDPSAEDGGLTTPLVDLQHSPLARLAFATPVGEVGGPLEQFGQYCLIRVEDRPAPLEGDWSRIREAVEASLAERPVEEGEFLQWKLALEREVGVDRSPLLELVGEPLD